MRYGVWVPNFGEYGDPRTLMALAADAEVAGWDGFFLWDHVLRAETVPIVDPWVALSAAAVKTERIRLGTLVTPLPRRRPSKLAREVASLDHLSGGRVILGVGSGSPPEPEFARFGEDPDPRVRAAKLDEGLEVLAGLWSGKPFRYEGKHYRVEGAEFLPTPIQSPRVPIWTAGIWPNRAPFHRAARWDGVFPLKRGALYLAPDDVREIVRFVAAERGSGAAFDVAVTGATPGDDPAEARSHVASFRDAGATWWLEWVGWRRGSLEEMRLRVRQGPPALAEARPTLA